MSVPARKRTYKPADARREQLLDCALEVFAGKGYHASSIADVCARAGIGRGTLYQYFDDKRDLLLALADRITSRITEACARRPRVRIPDGTSITSEQAVAFVEARFVEVLRVVFEDPRATRLVLRAGRGADGVVDRMLDRIDDAVLGLIEADLAEGQRVGLVRPFDTKLAARFFLGGLQKLVLAAVDDDRPLDVATLARETALLELCGILVHSPASPSKEST